jgi:hypothetical protein
VLVQSAASENNMYFKRRQSIRDSWLPALSALPMAAHAFVVSKPENEATLAAIHEEEKAHGEQFMILHTEVLSPLRQPLGALHAHCYVVSNSLNIEIMNDLRGLALMVLCYACVPCSVLLLR